MQRIISKHQHSDGLIGLWPQNQMLGTVSYDFSKDQGHGTHEGATNRYRMSRSKGHYMNATGYDPKAQAGAYTNILTPALIANFDGDAGAVFAFCKLDASWAEGINRYVWSLEDADGNTQFMRKDTVDGKLYYRHDFGGTSLSMDIADNDTTDWFCMAMMWDRLVNAECRIYLDGVYATRGINPGATGGADLVTAVIGAETTEPVGGWDGGVGIVALYNQIKTDDEMLKLSTP